MSSGMSLEDLQDRWTHLYKTRLPALAKVKDPIQPKWPVQLDHCFARIILDNAVGKDRPWAKVVKSPAYKNMSRQQLMDAIELGEKLASGEEDLVVLDEKSLALRGKRSKLEVKTQPSATKQKFKARGDDGAKDRNSEEETGFIERGDNKRTLRGTAKSSGPKDATLVQR